MANVRGQFCKGTGFIQVIPCQDGEGCTINESPEEEFPTGVIYKGIDPSLAVTEYNLLAQKNGYDPLTRTSRNPGVHDSGLAYVATIAAFSSFLPSSPKAEGAA